MRVEKIRLGAAWRCDPFKILLKPPNQWTAFDTYKADEITATVMEEFIKQAPELLGKILKEKGLYQKIAELAPSTEKQAA